MLSASTAPRTFSPILTVLVGLVCVQGACGLTSLDYLKNGHKQDGAVRDGAETDTAIRRTSSPDATIFDAFDVFVGVTGGAGGDGDVGMGTGGSGAGGATTDATGTGGDSIDGAVDTGAMDAAPEIDGAIVDSPIPDVGFLDGPFADSALPDSPPPSVALFVVGAIPLGPGDSAIQTRLIDKGYDVTLVKDTNLASITSVTATVVLISQTVTPANVTTRFRNTARPVMACEPSIFADMGFVDGTLFSQGSTLLSYSTLVVSSGAGELAAGLSGTVTVLQTAANMNYGTPNSQAVTVASVPGLSTLWAIFAYDTGAQMYNLAAPARRVGFFLADKAATDLTANGWQLFDAALAWLAM
jgi:hypothetical protein